MKKKNVKEFFIGLIMLLLFVLWTIMLQFVDVMPIGPNESEVGLSSINEFFNNLTGVNMNLYTITDWLGLVPFFVCFGFGILGLIQWIKRKNIFKVDRNILILGVFYVFVMAVYVLFEIISINYRPILINGILETSYPSSTTMLVMCVMPTSIMQLSMRIKNIFIKRCVVFITVIFTIFMVIGRLISGVHWISDIIGGGLFSCGAVIIYHSLTKILDN